MSFLTLFGQKATRRPAAGWSGPAPTSRWRFAADADDSVGSNDLANNGGVTFAGGVAVFDGAMSPELTRPDAQATNLRGFGGFTLAMRVYFDSSGAHPFVGKRSASGYQLTTFTQKGGGFRFKFEVGDGVENIAVDGTSNLSTGQWYSLFAWVDEGNDAAGIEWADDTPITGAWAGTLPDDATGGDFRVGFESGNYFDGLGSELWFWGGVILTAEQRAAWRAQF